MHIDWFSGIIFCLGSDSEVENSIKRPNFPHSVTLSPDIWKLEKRHKLKGDALSEGERKQTIVGHYQVSH